MSVSSYFHQTPEKLRQEQQWVIDAQKDPSGFAPLYNKYYTPILRYLKQKVNHPEAANEIASQVFIKALHKIHTFEFKGVPFGAWLYTIARTELIQSFRDQKRDRTVSLENLHLSNADEGQFEIFSCDLDMKKLNMSLKSLKPEQLRLIEMRFYQKMSFKEMADELGMTENNAKVKTFRVLSLLREVFKKKWQNAA